MYKRIEIDLDEPHNSCSFITGHEDLTKTASEASDEISKFVADLKIDKDKYVYVLINAMGAAEIYGPNNNGDAFPAMYQGKENLIHDGLSHGYKTFQTNAKVYKHHKNNDPKKSYGDVLLAVWNKKMHRVELVARIDRSKAPFEADKIDNLEAVKTSMGTKVPYDVCSICGHKAKTTAKYCSHLRDFMGKTLPDGRKCYAINPFPKFFDISMVFVPAESSSRVMKKLAGDKNAENKEAEITKRIPGGEVVSTDIKDIVDRLIEGRYGKLQAGEAPFSKERLDKMCGHPLKDIMSTMAFSGIMPKPEEFQRIILIKMNKRPLADMLDNTNIIFDESKYDDDSDLGGILRISPKHVNGCVAGHMSDMMPYRSVMQPHLLKRIVDKNMLFPGMGRRTSMNISPIMAAISGMYRKYREEAPRSIYSSIAKMLMRANMARAGSGGRVVVRVSRPSGTLGAIGEFLERVLSKTAGSNNIVDFGGCDKLYSFYKNSFNDGFDKTASDGQIAISMAKAFMGLPLMGFGGGIVKAAAINGSDGKELIIKTLSGDLEDGIVKKAGIKTLTTDMNIDMADLIYENGDLLNIVTLAKIAEMT